MRPWRCEQNTQCADVAMGAHWLAFGVSGPIAQKIRPMNATMYPGRDESALLAAVRLRPSVRASPADPAILGPGLPKLPSPGHRHDGRERLQHVAEVSRSGQPIGMVPSGRLRLRGASCAGKAHQIPRIIRQVDLGGGEHALGPEYQGLQGTAGADGDISASGMEQLGLSGPGTIEGRADTAVEAPAAPTELVPIGPCVRLPGPGFRHPSSAAR